MINKEDGITDIDVSALIEELNNKCGDKYRFYDMTFDATKISQKISTPLLTYGFSYSRRCTEDVNIKVAFKCRAWYDDNGVLVIGLLQRYNGVATT
jgi:hypothetical protein